jgi:hypothetical protein
MTQDAANNHMPCKQPVTPAGHSGQGAHYGSIPSQQCLQNTADRQHVIFPSQASSACRTQRTGSTSFFQTKQAVPAGHSRQAACYLSNSSQQCLQDTADRQHVMFSLKPAVPARHGGQAAHYVCTSEFFYCRTAGVANISKSCKQPTVRSRHCGHTTPYMTLHVTSVTLCD